MAHIVTTPNQPSIYPHITFNLLIRPAPKVLVISCPNSVKAALVALRNASCELRRSPTLFLIGPSPPDRLLEVVLYLLRDFMSFLFSFWEAASSAALFFSAS